MPEPRLKLNWEKPPRYPFTRREAVLPDGTLVSIFISQSAGYPWIFVEHMMTARTRESVVETIGRFSFPPEKGATEEDINRAKALAEQWATQTYPLAALGQISRENPKSAQLLRWEFVGHPMRSSRLAEQTQRLPDDTYFFLDENRGLYGAFTVLFRAPFSATSFAQATRIASGAKGEEGLLRGVAERIAQQDFPLLALAQFGKKNPDAKLEAKLLKVEALRRGATTPGERRAAQAAYDRIVNQLLAQPPPDPKPEPHRAPPPEVDRKELRETRKLLEKALRGVFGPSWGGLDGDTRAALLDEAYVLWLKAGGHRRVDLHRIALDVRRQGRGARDREVGIGEYDKDELADDFVDPAEAQETRAREAQAATVWQLLEDFSKRDEVSKMRATITQLHLGERVFPGQPNRLKGELPQRDLTEFHPGGGPLCPTCRAIARYVRVAGLTPDAVSQTVDGVLVELRQQLG